MYHKLSSSSTVQIVNSKIEEKVAESRQKALQNSQELQEDTDLEAIEDEEKKEERPKQDIHVFKLLRYLQRVCDHPRLVVSQESDIWSEVQSLMKKCGISSLRDISCAAKLIGLK